MIRLSATSGLSGPLNRLNAFLSLLHPSVAIGPLFDGVRFGGAISPYVASTHR